MAAPATHGLTFERVCSVEDIKVSGRLLVRLSNGRGVLLIFHGDGVVTACDHMCYHHGAPLFDGDIEDLDGVKW